MTNPQKILAWSERPPPRPHSIQAHLWIPRQKCVNATRNILTTKLCKSKYFGTKIYLWKIVNKLKVRDDFWLKFITSLGEIYHYFGRNFSLLRAH